MNKQEILDEINKTKEYLKNMEKMLEECEYKRWKPEANNKYYFVDGDLSVEQEEFEECNDYDMWKYTAYNCFKTKEEAEAEAEKILVRRQLEDIARRLNKGEKINWRDSHQVKHSLYFDYVENELFCSSASSTRKRQGTVYCLDKSFINIAIQEIGEERLKKYLRGE